MVLWALGFQILTVRRHHRKLRRGALRGNNFHLSIRDLQGDRDAINQRLEDIKHCGIPNYFGPQRFGMGGRNLESAEAMFSGTAKKTGRHQRGLYLSAARALLFNQVLSQRVNKGLWDQALPGETLQLEGKSARFLAEQVDEPLIMRLAALDIHPTGPLWGLGSCESKSVLSEFEWHVLEPFQLWREGLEAAGLEQDRRPLRVRVGNLEWEFTQTQTLDLHFTLPAGSYATVLLREFLADNPDI
jgi:tRNA pseudouridine13 synthase